jgi:hypothetical protein
MFKVGLISNGITPLGQNRFMLNSQGPVEGSVKTRQLTTLKRVIAGCIWSSIGVSSLTVVVQIPFAVRIVTTRRYPQKESLAASDQKMLALQ